MLFQNRRMKYKKEQRQKHSDKGLGKLDGNLSGDSDSEESYSGGQDSLSDCGSKSQPGGGSPDPTGRRPLPPGHMTSSHPQSPSPGHRSHPNLAMQAHYQQSADMYSHGGPPNVSQTSPSCLKQSSSPVQSIMNHPHPGDMNPVPMNCMNNLNNLEMSRYNNHHSLQQHYNLQMSHQNSHGGYPGGGGGHGGGPGGGGGPHPYMNPYPMYQDMVGCHEDPEQGQMAPGHMSGIPCGVGGAMSSYHQGPYDYIPKLTHL